MSAGANGETRSRSDGHTTVTGAALAVLIASFVVVGLATPFVGTVAAAQDDVAMYDGVNGSQISTATDGQTVYINANDSTTNGTTETVTVTNGSGGSISVTLSDDGSGDDPTGGDGEYWGSFTVNATTTDDSTDTLQVQDGGTASVTVDLDGQNDGASASVTADYGPVPQSATTHDNTTDGTVDNVTVTFDEAVGSTSVDASDFGISDGSVAGVTDVADEDDTLVLEVDGATSNDTAITPDVTVLQDSLSDTGGNVGPATGDVTVTASDGAAPAIVAAETADTDADGTVDQVNATLSEPLSDTASTLDSTTFDSVTGATVGSASTGTMADDDGIVVGVSGTPTDDTSVTLSDLVLASGTLSDGTNANGGQTVGTVADGAAPTFSVVVTDDLDANGYVDVLKVTYTESIASGTVEASDFSIGSANGLSGTVSGVSGDDGDGSVSITLSEGSTADTGATPTLSYAVSGGTDVQDAAGNLMVDTTSPAAVDAAAPQVTAVTSIDASSDGSVDRIDLTYSEDVSASSPEVGDYTLGGTDAGNVTLDSAGVTGDTVELSVTAPENDTALDLTLSYDQSAGTRDSVVDSVGQGAPSFADRTVADGAGPLMESVGTQDTDSDGTVDWLVVSFTETVDSGTIQAGDFASTTGTVDSVMVPLSADSVNLVVDGFPTDTSVTPDVTLAGNSITDDAGTPNSNPPQTLTAADSAPPTITGATTADADDDGNIDRIDVTLSESLDDGASTLDQSAFSLSSGSVDGVSTGVSADDDAVRLTVSGLSGSDATPDVTLAADSLFDPVGNAVGGSETFAGTTSGAAPVVQSATTLDRDGDGDVDAATVVFSGAVDDSTVTAGDWALGGTPADAVDTLATADDDTLQLRITTDANEVSGTGPVEVTYSPGTTAGTNGNSVASVAAGDVAEADGATPVITDLSADLSDGSGSRIEVTATASEGLSTVAVDLSGPQSRTLSSFSVSGSGPYTHTLTYDADVEGSYTATLRTAADDAGNDGASGRTDTVSVDLPDGGGAGPAPPGSAATRTSSTQVAVFSNARSATFDLDGGTIDGATVETSGSGTGFARATSLSSLPSGTSAPSTRVVGLVDLQMPDGWRDEAATLRIRVDLSETDADPERLQLVHHDAATDSWSPLETTVESRSDGTATLVGETTGFSLFAVTERAGQIEGGSVSLTVETATATPAATATPTQTATPTAADRGRTTTGSPATTAGSGPGFGPVAVGIALGGLAALGMGRYRRRRR
jgi:hypothetical protein